jgi:hypothetical protein
MPTILTEFGSLIVEQLLHVASKASKTKKLAAAKQILQLISIYNTILPVLFFF